MDLIKKAFLNGLIIEDSDIYPENPDIKHKGKNYYCLYKYKTNFIQIRNLLISFVIKNNLILFHVSPINQGSKEERFLRKNLKNFSF